MFKPVNKVAQRQKRHFRIRADISGTPSRPRLSVFRSNKAIYCQVIDDLAGATLVAASSRDFPDQKNGGNIEGAKLVGKLIAEKALEKGIKNVVFDRGGFLYHGRVKALAEAARAAGLEF
jgi:large subunit ribosomal protein L18